MDPDIPFPFEPYKIQEYFMKSLYKTLDQSQLGIFESPTGTGKSLSICCGALQWLKDNNKRATNLLENRIKELKLELSSKPSNDDWLQEEYEKIKLSQELVKVSSKLESLIKKQEKYDNLKQRVEKQKLKVHNSAPNYNTANINTKNDLKFNNDGDDQERIDDDLVLVDITENESDSDEETDKLPEDHDGEEESTKIFISSRTHSQLSQFVGEIKRTVFSQNTRVVTLASRQHFCINTDVNKLKNVHLINERCLDMQKTSKSTSVGEGGKVLKKSKTKSCSACPYYNQNNINNLKERLLVDIMDMEDLVKNGKELKACPYYASRMALADAEVVLLSHAGIVSEGARSGVSLKLDNNILILDEAHGLTSAIENAHSAPVSAKQLSSVKTFLHFYINKYKSRMSSKNLLALNQISFVVARLYGMICITTEEKCKEDGTTIMTLEDFVIKAEIDHMNLRPLVQFCRTTKLAPKLHGFSMRYSQQDLEDEINKSKEKKKSSLEAFLKSISKAKANDEVVVKSEEVIVNSPNETSAGSGLYAILDFIEMLCQRSENGRVLVQTSTNQTGLLKYMLLNASDHFTDVVQQCRSVIVAGGTMEPIQEFKDLFTGNNKNPTNTINVVKCDHVVPQDNVLGICLSNGPTNVGLNFTFENRQSKLLLDEVGRILRNISQVVPGGVVCFLPSYSYEQTLFDHLKNTNSLEAIGRKKKVFREPKNAVDVDNVLSNYAKAVKCKDSGLTGAILLSVVGGKLSEGLNFSDDLGRCVMVIGMPYPNVKSKEIQEKLNYLNRTKGAGAGNEYYENLCMKAVNQCIGRAVRHINDYACIILVDERFSRTQTVDALPTFVRKSLLPKCTFGAAVGSVAKFFAKQKGK